MAMRPIDRGCLNKRRFDSREECEEAIKHVRAFVPLYAYQCQFNPEHWHMTKQPQHVGADVPCGTLPEHSDATVLVKSTKEKEHETVPQCCNRAGAASPQDAYLDQR